VAGAASRHEVVVSLKMKHTEEQLSRYERVGAMAVYWIRHVHPRLGEEARLRGALRRTRCISLPALFVLLLGARALLASAHLFRRGTVG